MSRARRFSSFLCMLSVASCVTLEARTARQTGCDETDVVVSAEQGALNKTWRATCGGASYVCNYRPPQSQGVGGISVSQKEIEACVEETAAEE